MGNAFNRIECLSFDKLFMLFFSCAIRSRKIMSVTAIHRQTLPAGSWFDNRCRVRRSYDHYRWQTNQTTNMVSDYSNRSILNADWICFFFRFCSFCCVIQGHCRSRSFQVNWSFSLLHIENNWSETNLVFLLILDQLPDPIIGERPVLC